MHLYVLLILLKKLLLLQVNHTINYALNTLFKEILTKYS